MDTINDIVSVKEVLLEKWKVYIRLSGTFGSGSLGNDSGRQIQKTIIDSMKKADAKPHIIILDFQSVDYEWGDGIIWSLYGALLKNIRIEFRANLNNAAWMHFLTRLHTRAAIRRIATRDGTGNITEIFLF